jgi:hypothetical protein
MGFPVVIGLLPFTLYSAILFGAVGGPILFVYGLLAYLYHKTGSKEQQPSILILEGPEAGRIEIFKETGIRFGVDVAGKPMISQSASELPDQYWILTHGEGQWRIKRVTGTLAAHVNDNPVDEVETLEPGDRIRVGDIYASFDSFKNNRALMP